ncbi:MAG: nuclear transport factor 2 family protein [Ktedonobacteraceae bacterium]|nr:nuclear transport factor 2 family protein [Ktedonobacteraceae bacterium]MBO0792399.1 nuclear transport factor 2 family protein [Ktedonobacteraceae bacterium]
MPEELSFTTRFLGETTFSGAQNRQVETGRSAFEGAAAALETFYHGFNTRTLEVLRQNWLDAPQAQLNNPVGGIKRGLTEVMDVYARIFAGSACVRVEFYDIVAYTSSAMAVFAGRERGTYERDGNVYPLDIRTTRIFAYTPEQGGWRQVHHHGSIDSAERLAHYVQTALGS